MKTILRTLLAMAVCTSLIGFVGCKKEEGTFEKMGKSVDKAAQDTEKAAKDAAADAEKAADDATK